MENFNWPYLKSNIQEFWRSWHVSLTSWVRDYVYMVIVSISRSPVLAAIGGMLVIGLWHEASLRYIVWGLYHAGGIVVWQRFQKVKRLLPQAEQPWARHVLHGLAVLLTFHFVMLGFALVKEPDLADGFGVMMSILLFWV
jgi:alginate O-acetyltransferase complex protein AlgI